MDFEEDLLALEAYIREKTLWRDEDEVSGEEWCYYAEEYMRLHPFPDEPIFVNNECVMYQRWSGQFITLRRLPGVPFYWERGHFFKGMANAAEYWADYCFVGTSFRFLHWRFWFEYVGLASPRRHFPPAFVQTED